MIMVKVIIVESYTVLKIRKTGQKKFAVTFILLPPPPFFYPQYALWLALYLNWKPSTLTESVA